MVGNRQSTGRDSAIFRILGQNVIAPRPCSHRELSATIARSWRRIGGADRPVESEWGGRGHELIPFRLPNRIRRSLRIRVVFAQAPRRARSRRNGPYAKSLSDGAPRTSELRGALADSNVALRHLPSR